MDRKAFYFQKPNRFVYSFLLPILIRFIKFSVLLKGFCYVQMGKLHRQKYHWIESSDSRWMHNLWKFKWKSVDSVDVIVEWMERELQINWYWIINVEDVLECGASFLGYLVEELISNMIYLRIIVCLQRIYKNNKADVLFPDILLNHGRYSL